MKNKKGFTLIELLAVIVILAIIALIATPIILNMINDARKSAAVDSAYGYVEAIEYNNSIDQLSDKYDPITSGDVSEINNKVNLKGTKPTSGEVTIEKGRVTEATLVINGYTISYKNGEATVEGKKDSETEDKIVYEYTNSNIKAAYKYNEDPSMDDYCVTGEEETCKQISVTKGNTYEVGTIIKYQVNDNITKFFHVLHDDGSTLTLQQRENTTTSSWTTATGQPTNQTGPLTALTAIEEITNNWNNVNNITYKMGTTIFNDNSYTGCASGMCTTNTYTLDSRTSKARIISYQEALALGCKSGTVVVASKSCPIWMYNYLESSVEEGATKDDVNGTVGYWALNASSDSSFTSTAINQAGMFDAVSVLSSRGLRAVVQINK